MSEQEDAAASALGGSVPGQDSPNSSDHHEGDNAASGGAQPKSKATLIIIVGLTVVLITIFLVCLLLLTKGAERRIESQNIETGSKVMDDSQLPSLNAFMTRYAESANRAEDRMNKQDIAIKAIADQNAALADRFEHANREQKEMNDKILEVLRTGNLRTDSKTPSIPDAGNADKQAQIVSTLHEFEDRLLKLSMEPKAARDAATTRLRTLKVDPVEIPNLLAASAQKAGRYFIGDVHEEYPTVEDASKMLPQKLAETLPEVVQLMAGLARDNGQLLPAQCYDDVYNLARTRLAFTPDEKELTKDNITKLCLLGRTRRENLDDNEMDYIPYLIQRMKGMGVPKERTEIVKFLWSQRTQLPSTITPGKMVTLLDVLSRKINNTEDPEIKKAEGLDNSFRQMTGEDADRAIIATKTALSQAVARGRPEVEAKRAGSKAMGEYFDAARITASEEMKARILDAAWKDVLEERRLALNPTKPSGSTPAAAPSGTTSAPPPSAGSIRMGEDVKTKIERTEFTVPFGPLSLRRSHLVNSVTWMGPTIIKLLDVDPQSQQGVGMQAAIMQQAPQLLDDLISSGSLSDAGDIRSSLVPQLIQIMRNMQPLAAIDLRVSPDPGTNDSRVGRAFRGAVLGAIFGPLLSDKDKAQRVSKEAMVRVESAPPLTAEKAKEVNEATLQQPYALALTVINGYSPGISPNQPNRFQNLTQFAMERVAASSSYANAIAPAFVKDKDDNLGRFNDLLRLFVPIAIAVRDDGRTPIEAVKEQVENDIRLYTAMYASEFLVSTRTVQETIPSFAMSVADEAGGPTKLIQVASQEVPKLIARLVQERQITVTASNMLPTAQAIAAEVFPQIEKRLARETVMSRVEPRIRRANALASKADITDMITAATADADSVVIPPYTPANLDQWASDVSGRARLRTPDQRSGPGLPPGGAPSPLGGKGAANKPVVKLSTVTGTKTGKMTGSEKDVVKSKKITIPAISRCKAHLLNGADPEFGGGGTSTESDPVYLNVSTPWITPDGGSMRIPNMKLAAKSKARAGASRVSLELSAYSLVFPSKLTQFADCSGDVFDPQDGHVAVKGAWNLNIDKVVPLAVLVGGGKGISDAIKSNSSTQIVGINGVTTTANTGSQLETALFGGLGGAADILTGKTEAILKDVNSTVSIDGGVEVDVIISKPIVFDVPEKEFDEYQRQTNGGGTFNAR